MKLHNLTSIQKRSQRIGRGGKRGSYSGRGVKGQKSRAGRRIRPAERDLIIRLPKLRGFRNKPKSEISKVFNLGTISSACASPNFLEKNLGGHTPVPNANKQIVITKEFLKTAGLLGKKFKGKVKILGVGEIAFPVSIRGISLSESARKKIEKAGGKIITSD
jgi:large subunit ribosomal protein L15